jgi:hypothetical protein
MLLGKLVLFGVELKQLGFQAFPNTSLRSNKLFSRFFGDFRTWYQCFPGKTGFFEVEYLPIGSGRWLELGEQKWVMLPPQIDNSSGVCKGREKGEGEKGKSLGLLPFPCPRFPVHCPREYSCRRLCFSITFEGSGVLLC